MATFQFLPVAASALLLILFIPAAPLPAQACTLFAAPSGKDANSGRNNNAPKSFTGATNAAQPGDVVCLKAGTYTLTATFYPPRSGTPNAWIVYKAWGDGPVVMSWAGKGTGDNNMFHFYSPRFPSGPHYLEFRGLTLEGHNQASYGFFCHNSHHLRFIGNTVKNQGSGGIGGIFCDYLTADHNLLYHIGYAGGGSSAISYNSSQFYDTYPGLHNIVSNNIIAGTYDSSAAHTDGNAIIMDLSAGSYDPSTAHTPPALILNNVAYGNGGRCIENYVVTNIWTINNTCYANGLDLSTGGFSSFDNHDSSSNRYINNIAYSINAYPFIIQGTVNNNLDFTRNMIWGGSLKGFSSSKGFVVAKEISASPPPFRAGVNGQYATAPPPWELGDALTLAPGSPARNAGIDPIIVARRYHAPAALISDLKKYIYRDINGRTRTPGRAVDLGAYQH